VREAAGQHDQERGDDEQDSGKTFASAEASFQALNEALKKRAETS
jgi:hypothetical protein